MLITFPYPSCRSCLDRTTQLVVGSYFHVSLVVSLLQYELSGEAYSMRLCRLAFLAHILWRLNETTLSPCWFCFVLMACLSSVVMSEEGCLALCVRFRVSLVALSGTLKLVDVHTSVMKKMKREASGPEEFQLSSGRGL